MTLGAGKAFKIQRFKLFELRKQLTGSVRQLAWNDVA
jgi:hypothetical protein